MRRKWSRRLIPLYIKMYRIDTRDVVKDVSEFDSLLDFFIRRLRADARPIDTHPERIVSPVDGTVAERGTIRDNQLIQAKGYAYTVEQLLGGDEARAASFYNGSFITLYLSPRDYHRIHAPIAAGIEAMRYIPGELYPVNERGIRLVRQLYVRNERLISYLLTDCGTVALVKVGATNVGSIKVDYDPTIGTNVKGARPAERLYEPAIAVHKGEELGRFEFGSTVILLFPPQCVTFLPRIKAGEAVRVGEPIAHVLSLKEGK